MRHVLTFLVLVLAPAGLQASTSEPHTCYAWSDAAPIVQREKLMSAKDMQEQTRKQLDGALLRLTLCEEKGQFVYKLVVQDDGGKVKHVTVNAKAPF